MRVDGQIIKPQRFFTYQSVSEKGKEYRTTQWGDGFVSCNCTGWAIHKKCWHTADVASLMGANSLSSADRVANLFTTPTPALRVVPASQPASVIVEHRGQRFRRLIGEEE